MSDEPILPDSPDDSFAVHRRDSTRIGDMLRYYRVGAGLSQYQLARASDVHENNISSIENGTTTRPWNSTLKKLADVLARYYPTTPSEIIYERLLAAKDNRLDRTGVLPGIYDLNARIETLHPALRERALASFNRTLDEWNMVEHVLRRNH